MVKRGRLYEGSIRIGSVIEGEGDPSALYVDSAEWIDEYAGLTDEQKQAIVAQFEPPPEPVAET